MRELTRTLWRSAVGCALAFALWLANATVARGEDLPTEVTIAYAASARCPSESEFLALLRKRLARVELARTSGAPFHFDVTLSESDGGARGRLEARAPDRGKSVRELRGRSCRAVATALALVIVLAADPEAPHSELDFDADPGASSGAGARAPDASQPKSVAPGPPSPGREPARPARVPQRRDPAVAPRTESWRFTAGLSAGVVQAPLPGVGLQSSVFAGAEPTSRTALRIYGSYLLPRSESYIWGRARVEAAWVGLQGCPWGWFAGSVGFRPCVGFEAGRLSASGEVTEEGGTSRAAKRFLASAVVLGRAEWAVSPRFRAELQGSVDFALTRYRYVVTGPETTAAEARVTSAGVELGAGLVF